MKNRSLPLQEIISRIGVPAQYTTDRLPIWAGLGTMPRLNKRWANQPGLDFINYNLRGVGQVIFVNNPLSGLLILLALFIQSPWIGLMSLVAVVSSTATAIALQLDRDTIRSGIFGYNGILVGAALGTFGLSGNGGWNLWWAIAVIIFSALTTVMMKTCGVWWATTFRCSPPFCVATIAFFALLRGSLSSLVPVALYAITSPEEHRYRYLVAKKTISNFRRQLQAAINGESVNLLFDKASTATKGDLRYVFEAIDTDRSGELSTQKLANYLIQADRATSEDELSYLFNCMDRDNSGTIDFEEFGELILRHQRLMMEYDAFTTYFVPIDADENDFLSIQEMNVAMTSVSEPALTREEIDLLQQRTNSPSFTWNQFIELLLLT